MKPLATGALLQSVFELKDPGRCRSLQCITVGVKRVLDLNLKSKSVHRYICLTDVSLDVHTAQDELNLHLCLSTHQEILIFSFIPQWVGIKQIQRGYHL